MGEGYNKEYIDERFKGVDEKINVANHRISDLETEMKYTKDLVNAISSIDKKVDVLSTDVGNKIGSLSKDVCEIKTDLSEIKKKPSDWLEKIIWLVIGGVITGVFTIIKDVLIK